MGQQVQIWNNMDEATKKLKKETRCQQVSNIIFIFDARDRDGVGGGNEKNEGPKKGTGAPAPALSNSGTT